MQYLGVAADNDFDMPDSSMRTHTVVYSSSIKRYIKRYMQYLGVAANDFNMSDIHARIGKDTRQM